MLQDEIGHQGWKSIGGRQRDSARLYVKLCGGESRLLRQFAATALRPDTDWVGPACDKGAVSEPAELGIDDNEPSLTPEEKTATVRDLLLR
jgi:hypothetical protein